MTKSLKEGAIEELKNHADIQTIVSGYVNLKKSGKNYIGLCPFHKEKTPSFVVDTRKQLYHCFGCGEGGDIISFIMKIENLDFIEAAEFLAKKVNYNLEYVYTDTPIVSEKRTRLIEICELAKKYYKYILANSKVASGARDYLSKRGIKKETIEYFELGFSPQNWESFSKFALKRGYKPQELIESGLSLQGMKGNNKIYDRFRGRIMFPIKDIVGKTIGFGGRIINGTQKTGSEIKIQKQQVKEMEKVQAKYINSPETKIYSKSKNIYGLFEAKKNIVENDTALVVEGYTDKIILYQEGIKNVVASLGTALTTEQVGLIGRFTKNIILVFDSDKAGVSASLRGIERLREYNQGLDLYNESNINIKVALLEEGYDPAEYILKKGRDKFLERLDKAVHIIDFTIDMILKKYNTNNMSGKLSASDELLEFILTLSSKIIQEECIKKISEKLNLRESLLIEQLQKKSSMRSLKRAENKFINTVVTEEESKQEEKAEAPFKNIEIEALKVIINGIGKNFYDLVDIGEEYFRFEDTKKLYGIIKEVFSQNKNNIGSINFPLKISSDKLEDEKVNKLYNMIIFSPVKYSDSNLACLEVYNNLKRTYIIDKIDETRKRLKKFEIYRKKHIELISSEKLKKVDEEITALNLKLKELENELFKYK